jgi:DNA repair exonuclease SbcCD nuclease subunit
MRFIHTSDWQLGMSRHFLDADAQARFSEARETVIRRIGLLAQEQRAEFVVVAGDVFETNLLYPRTVRRALDALGEFSVPVYLLPGNHDPLDPASIYRSSEFLRHKPEQVHVIETDNVLQILPEVEIVGVPWMSKHMSEERLRTCLEALPPLRTSFRIMLAHGQMTSMGFDETPGVILVNIAEEALAAGTIHYLALGDRHSTTPVGTTRRIWYSGAPEPTDYDEVDAGNILMVDLLPNHIEVTPIPVGTWSFVERLLDVRQGEAVQSVRTMLEALPEKPRTIVKLNLRGTIGLMDQIGIDALLDEQRQVFGAIERHVHRDQLAVLPDSGEFANLSLSGYTRVAFEQLLEGAKGSGAEAERYGDALALFYRLAQEE